MNWNLFLVCSLSFHFIIFLAMWIFLIYTINFILYASGSCTIPRKVFPTVRLEKIYLTFYGTLWFLFFTVKSLIHLKIILLSGEVRISLSFFQMFVSLFQYHKDDLRTIQFNFKEFYNLLVAQDHCAPCAFYRKKTACEAFSNQPVISN